MSLQLSCSLCVIRKKKNRKHTQTQSWSMWRKKWWIHRLYLMSFLPNCYLIIKIAVPLIPLPWLPHITLGSAVIVVVVKIFCQLRMVCSSVAYFLFSFVIKFSKQKTWKTFQFSCFPCPLNSIWMLDTRTSSYWLCIIRTTSL